MLLMKTGKHLRLLAAALLLPMLANTASSQPRHAIAMHGEPAMPEGFASFPYVNPDAPKGGRRVQGVLGTFDSLNPLIVKGVSVPEMRSYVLEGLMARGYDEPFTLYGLLASTVETDAERSYVTFGLNPAAKFSDGKLIVVNAFDVKEAKTKAFREALDNLKVDKTALLVEVANHGNRNLVLSSRNIDGVELVATSEVHPFHLLRYDRTIFSQPAIEKLQASLKNSVPKRQRQAGEPEPKAAKKASRSRSKKTAEVA